MLFKELSEVLVEKACEFHNWDIRKDADKKELSELPLWRKSVFFGGSNSAPNSRTDKYIVAFYIEAQMKILFEDIKNCMWRDNG